jgi:hypothetical protein
MKKIILFCALSALAGNAFAQKETFDITTYTPLKGWKKQPAESAIQFSKEDAAKGTYCLITLYKAVPGTASSKENFDLAWVSLVKEMVTVSTAPEMQPVTTENAWETQSGLAPFDSDGNKGVVLLATATAADKMVNLIILTNTDVYEKEMTAFLESISLKKTETIPQHTPGTNDDKNFILGSWGKSNTVSQINNRFGNYSYNKQQYTFNADGSYGFAAKTYDEKYSETYLIKERGRYVISGKTITLTPKTSAIEAWSKKNGADNWNQLRSTQKRPLEIVTYQFSIADNNLLLQTGKQTARDGNFNNGSTYMYGPPGTFTPIVLPGGEQILPTEMQKKPVKEVVIQPEPSVTNSGFAFTSTNFDNGWTSTVQEDWVQITKGNIKVLIHYPNKNADAYNSVVLEGLKNAWNILIAPKYSSASNFEFKPITGWQTIEFAEADMVEKGTNKSVHVVLFKMNYSNGSGKYLEFITSDKNAFEQEFGVYHQTTSGWEKMEDMAAYNKFAVSTSDLTGKWTSDFSGAIQYVNAYTGFDAGMDTHASVENFNIGSGGTYNWDLGVASGQVGNIKFQSRKSSGRLSMTGNWKANFSDIEGKPRTYNVHFSCIKGLRVLWLDGKPFAKAQ